MKLTTLDYQPEFPEVDLTDNNAAFLEVFLQNNTIIEAAHPQAEKHQLLYEIAHSLVKDSKDNFNDESHYAGLTHGFTLYEIISSVVSPQPLQLEKPALITAAKGLTWALHSSRFNEYLTDAYDDFTHQQTVTAEVVSNAASRYHPGLTHYAVMGAAIERQLELEARDLNQNIVQ